VDFNRARPEENRFTRVVLAEKLDEPIELAVLPDERVLFIERHGYVNLYKPSDARVRRIATIPREHEVRRLEPAEDGLLGSPPIQLRGERLGLHVLLAGRTGCEECPRAFTMTGDSLDLASQRVLSEIPTQRLQCCHTGGSIAFDAQGNLYLSTATTRIRSPPHMPRSTSAPAGCRGTPRNSSANTKICAQGSSASSRAGRPRTRSRMKPLPERHAEDSGRDLHDGPSKPVSDLGR